MKQEPLQATVDDLEARVKALELCLDQSLRWSIILANHAGPREAAKSDAPLAPDGLRTDVPLIDRLKETLRILQTAKEVSRKSKPLPPGVRPPPRRPERGDDDSQAAASAGA